MRPWRCAPVLHWSAGAGREPRSVHRPASTNRHSRRPGPGSFLDATPTPRPPGRTSRRTVPVSRRRRRRRRAPRKKRYVHGTIHTICRRLRRTDTTGRIVMTNRGAMVRMQCSVHRVLNTGCFFCESWRPLAEFVIELDDDTCSTGFSGPAPPGGRNRYTVPRFRQPVGVSR